MKILITGAGEVGFELGRVLSEEKHDVTVLDERKKCLERVSDHLDVLTVEGNATSPKALVEAGAGTADLMVAVTSSDEVNIIASMMAKRLGVNKVIARVRNDELTQSDSPILPSELGIDLIIHPEEAAAKDIFQLVKRASASDVVPLADGQLQLIGIRIEEKSEIAGKTLEEIVSGLSDNEIPFRVVAISRRGTTIIPRGQNRLMAMDHIFLITKTVNVKKFIQMAGHSDQNLKKIMIAGGSDVGRMLAKKMVQDSQNWQIKIIEPNQETAENLAYEYRDLLVLNGDPTDPNLLVIEGVQEMDAFISVTDDEESNIISCLMAKHLEVKKTVAMVSKKQYVPLSQTIGIDAIVNVKSSASDEIHRQIRQVILLTVKALHGIKAEIIEVIASKNCKMLNDPIYKLNLPDGIVIGAILRGDESIIVTGDTVVQKDDRVIILALPNAIEKVEQLF